MTFVRTDISPTVYGIETEYTLTVTKKGGECREFVGACHSTETPIEMHDTPLNDQDSHVVNTYQINRALGSLGIHRNTDSGLLSNGGRLYLDISGPEYCTPETTSAEEAVLRTFDGDEILYAIMRYLQDKGEIESFQINRRCTDHNRNSRGVHLNHATILDELSPEEINVLATINAAKGAMFGSGGLLMDRDGSTSFYHSPRLALTDSLSTPSYVSRALVRSEFKEDYDDIRRIETVTSDALSFAWPLRASLVLSNTVIKLLELRDADDRFPIFGSPVIAAQIIAQHGASARVGIELDGKNYMVHPQGIIKSYAEFALERNKEFEFLDDESIQVLAEIIEVADLLSSGEEETLMTRVESIFRKYLIERKMEQRNADLGSEILCKVDYEWDKVGGGRASVLRRYKGVGWHGFSKEHSFHEEKRRLTTPPNDTRAAIRGNLIADSRGGYSSDKWHEIELPSGLSYAVHPLLSDIKDLID